MAASHDYETLAVEVADGVGHVRMEAAGGMTSLTATMADDLLDAATALGADDDVRCVALTGTGDTYNVGADLSALSGGPDDEPAIRRLASTLHDALLGFHRSGVPVVTGVNGVAAGAGFGLAVFADVVLVSDAARLEFAYPRVGLVGDGGSTFLLPRLVGLRRALEVALLDEPVPPERAVELGLATEVVPDDDLDDRLRSVAGELADGPTAALGELKRLLRGSFDRDLAGQLAAETDAIARATRTEDYRRGHAAFFGEEDPEFVGR